MYLFNPYPIDVQNLTSHQELFSESKNFRHTVKCQENYFHVVLANI